MRFLDLDLDFFLSSNAYGRPDRERPGAEYKPWNVSVVRRFLEGKCHLSRDKPTPGRILEHHDLVIDFWKKLIESGGLKVPFEVIHVDAHPDITVRGGLYLKSGMLRIDSKAGLEVLNREQVHQGNYLTFAIASGWIASLVWVPLRKTFKELPGGYIEETHSQGRRRQNERNPLKGLTANREQYVPYKILLWHRLRTNKTFDYMALSKSPGFTPPESDALVSVIEEYMTQI